MKVTINQMKCNGAGICVQELSTLFRFQEGSKKATTLQTEVPKELESIVTKVARMCPSKAVVLSTPSTPR